MWTHTNLEWSWSFIRRGEPPGRVVAGVGLVTVVIEGDPSLASNTGGRKRVLGLCHGHQLSDQCMYQSPVYQQVVYWLPGTHTGHGPAQVRHSHTSHRIPNQISLPGYVVTSGTSLGYGSDRRDQVSHVIRTGASIHLTTAANYVIFFWWVWLMIVCWPPAGSGEIGIISQHSQKLKKKLLEVVKPEKLVTLRQNNE